MQPPGIQVIQVDGGNDSDSEDDDDDDDDDDDKKDKSQEGLDEADFDVSVVHYYSELSLRRTASGPALTVCLEEVSAL